MAGWRRGIKVLGRMGAIWSCWPAWPDGLCPRCSRPKSRCAWVSCWVGRRRSRPSPSCPGGWGCPCQDCAQAQPKATALRWPGIHLPDPVQPDVDAERSAALTLAFAKLDLKPRLSYLAAGFPLRLQQAPLCADPKSRTALPASASPSVSLQGGVQLDGVALTASGDAAGGVPVLLY